MRTEITYIETYYGLSYELGRLIKQREVNGINTLKLCQSIVEIENGYEIAVLAELYKIDRDEYYEFRGSSLLKIEEDYEFICIKKEDVKLLKYRKRKDDSEQKGETS